MNGIGDFVDELISFSRIINDKKSKDFPTPYYLPMSGKLVGYQESDKHFRKRILNKLKEA